MDRTESIVRQVNAGPYFQTLIEGESQHSSGTLVIGLAGIGKDFAEIGFGEFRLRAGRESNLGTGPGNFRNPNSLSGGNGSFHARIQALGDMHPSLGRTVVVLARCYVTSTPCEINLGYTLFFFQARSRQARHVGVHVTLAIVALRVRGIIVQPREGALPVKQSDGAQPGVD